MSISLGLDTGGTYTDAVLFDTATNSVIAKAKALTTRHDLAVGIENAAQAVLKTAGIAPGEISLVSISTTLATNALVEGQGSRAALVLIGFDESALDRGGLRAALGDDPLIMVSGGHDVHGHARPLDPAAARDAIHAVSDAVSAFAVAGYFAVRNPDHEIALRDLISAQTGKAVTCSHELTAKLDGPKRALTTLLNARLIALITGLIDATAAFLSRRGIEAPLMVVRGDGSLVSAGFARLRPIETILSGPAASLVGAAHLTGARDAIVADIGGTTTDIAILDAGRPRLDANGASVGGFNTMVDAVAMRTFGLAGDSEVRLDEDALDARLTLGPRRVVPLSLMGAEHGDLIHAALDRQLRATVPTHLDGRFIMRTGLAAHFEAGLRQGEARLLARLDATPQPLDTVMNGMAELATADRLAARGLVVLCGLTPSDAQHVLGAFTHWDRDAAEKGAALFARRRDGRGRALTGDAVQLSQQIVSRLRRLSAECVLETVFCGDELDGRTLARAPLVARMLDGQSGIAALSITLDRPLVGLGAAAHAYYPAIAGLIGCDYRVPDHADVANAVGAVTGLVRVAVELNVLADGESAYVITGAHLSADDPVRHGDEKAAIAAAHCLARDQAADLAAKAGAHDARIDIETHVNAVDSDGQRQFVDATITATGTGRPAATG